MLHHSYGMYFAQQIMIKQFFQIINLANYYTCILLDEFYKIKATTQEFKAELKKYILEDVFFSLSLLFPLLFDQIPSAWR